ncbi:MAG: serine O-acetyltransferase [Ruminococcaceae bacterium]|jgi:serine O-acetyltransferase|nr:serine O-acetyltransferase [Oscillospiraceae bacterium]
MDKKQISIRLASPVSKAVYRELRELSEELDSIMERDPAAVSRTEVALLYSGFHAVLMYRAAHAMQEKGWKIPARAVSQFAKFLTGIEIHPGAKIGRGLFIDHGAGVVIGETAEIGDNCTLYQGVTLGGTGKQTGKRHPTLGDNVMVGAGAKILGGFKVGSGSRIAAGAVVLREVPENATAVGVPARVVRVAGQPVQAGQPDSAAQSRGTKDGRASLPECTSSLDQVNIPNPVDAELAQLRRHVRMLEEKLGLDPIPDAETFAPDGSGI